MTPDRQYMQMELKVFRPHIAQQYNLNAKVKNTCVYLETRQVVYGLPQMGILANKQILEKLKPKG